MEVSLEDMIAASPPRRQRGGGAESPPPAELPAAAASSGRERRPQRAAAAKARNMFAPLTNEAEMVDEDEYQMPSSPASSSSAPSPKAAAPRGKKTGKKAAKKAAKKAPARKNGGKKTSSGKPRAPRGEKLRQDAAAAAAAAAASAAAAANAPSGLVRKGKEAIAAADAERKAATEKLRQLSESGKTYVSPLSDLKDGEHGVAKAPYYSAERAAAARKLPSVAKDACGAVTSGWPEDTRRADAQLTAKQRERRGPSTRTWCSREENKVGVDRPNPPDVDKPTRGDFQLPAPTQPTAKQKRAVVLRVRFVDQTADAGGVMGAAAPVPGKKTWADVRRAFSKLSKAALLAYNAGVKLVYAHPAQQQLGVALDDGFMYSVLITKTPTAFVPKKNTPGTPEYDAAKAAHDQRAAKVKAARDTYCGGKTLPEAHQEELSDVPLYVLSQALRDVRKAFTSNIGKQQAQRARGEQVKPFTVSQKDPRKRSSHTFCLPAEYIRASHVERPELYRRSSKAEAKRQAKGETSSLGAHLARQPRRRKWTQLSLPSTFAGSGKRHERAIVYLTRCADLAK